MINNARATTQGKGDSRADLDNRLYNKVGEMRLKGLSCLRLLLGKQVHGRRVQDMVYYSDSSKEPADTVTDLRGHVLAQQLRGVRVNRGHVPIELVSKLAQKS